MKTTQIEITANSDLSTAVHMERTLKAIPGVVAVAVELSKGRVTLEHEDVDPEKLRRAIISSGGAATIIPEDAEVVSPSVPNLRQETDATSGGLARTERYAG